MALSICNLVEASLLCGTRDGGKKKGEGKGHRQSASFSPFSNFVDESAKGPAVKSAP